MTQETSEVKCPKCNGTKWYQYSTTGTPHSKICEVCCTHEGTPVADTANGKPNDYYCAVGCGTKVPAPKQEVKKSVASIQVPRCTCHIFMHDGSHQHDCPYAPKTSWPVCPECQFEIDPAHPYHQSDCSKGKPPTDSEDDVVELVRELELLAHPAGEVLSDSERLNEFIRLANSLCVNFRSYVDKVADANQLLLSKREWDKAKQEGREEALQEVKGMLPERSKRTPLKNYDIGVNHTIDKIENLLSSLIEQLKNKV